MFQSSNIQNMNFKWSNSLRMIAKHCQGTGHNIFRLFLNKKTSSGATVEGRMEYKLCQIAHSFSAKVKVLMLHGQLMY
jgi:hypothetical protein